MRARTRSRVNRGRRLRVAGVVTAGLVVVTILAALPDHATAETSPVVLLGTMPADSEEVVRPPEVARVVFSAPVEAVDEGVEVRDARGRRVDSGPTEPPSPAVVEAALPADLPAGDYAATWQVRDGEGTVLEGAWDFVVTDDPDGEVVTSEGPRGPWIAVAVGTLLLAAAGLGLVLIRRR